MFRLEFSSFAFYLRALYNYLKLKLNLSPESEQVYTNLALNQLAEQQDDYRDGNGPASKAVDGNRDGAWRWVKFDILDKKVEPNG